MKKGKEMEQPNRIDKEKLLALPKTIILAGFPLADRSIFIGKEKLTPEHSLELKKHADGFDWGYAGSMPAQLALAILAKYLEDQVALTLYQGFKLTMISQLPQGNFRVQIKLRDFILALAGYSTGKPKHPKEYIKELDLDLELINIRGGYSANFREIPAVSTDKVVDKLNSETRKRVTKALNKNG